jgi:hypothetical protein
VNMEQLRQWASRQLTTLLGYEDDGAMASHFLSFSTEAELQALTRVVAVFPLVRTNVCRMCSGTQVPPRTLQLSCGQGSASYVMYNGLEEAPN